MNTRAARNQQLFDDLRERILVLDGAIGTMLLGYDLREEEYRDERFAEHVCDLRGNLDILTLTRPDIIEVLHRAYLNAGADIIGTNTFSSTALMQAAYGTDNLVSEINEASAGLARRVADHFEAYFPADLKSVAGIVGPTNRCASPNMGVLPAGFLPVRPEELQAAYEEQIRGLIAGGADLLLIESVYFVANAGAALEAARRVQEETGTALPVWVSISPDKTGERLLFGDEIEELVDTAAPYRPFCLGCNCGYDQPEPWPTVERLAELTKAAVSVHPAAGLPDTDGRYAVEPEDLAERIVRYAEAGTVNIVGGCCGTTPEHIRAVAAVVSTYSPRDL